jgi:hypothetical protein
MDILSTYGYLVPYFLSLSYFIYHYYFLKFMIYALAKVYQLYRDLVKL